MLDDFCNDCDDPIASVLILFPKNAEPLALGLACGAAKHAAPEWLRRVMPFAQCSTVAPGLVAQ